MWLVRTKICPDITTVSLCAKIPHSKDVQTIQTFSRSEIFDLPFYNDSLWEIIFWTTQYICLKIILSNYIFYFGDPNDIWNSLPY